MAANKQTVARVAGCTGKKRHRTAGDAVGFACRTARMSAGVRPYECSACRGWHLTTMVAPRKGR